MRAIADSQAIANQGVTLRFSRPEVSRSGHQPGSPCGWARRQPGFRSRQQLGLDPRQRRMQPSASEPPITLTGNLRGRPYDLIPIHGCNFGDLDHNPGNVTQLLQLERSSPSIAPSTSSRSIRRHLPRCPHRRPLPDSVTEEELRLHAAEVELREMRDRVQHFEQALRAVNRPGLIGDSNS